jgi:uncharacterized membrane protein YbhN (UPF0104 family)
MTAPPEFQPVRRSTGEVVLVIVTVTLGAMLLAAVILVGVLKIKHPELNTDTLVGSLTGTVTVLVGAVVGFLAGRRGERGAP